MSALKPESAELITYYADHVDAYRQIADSLRIPKFSNVDIKELTDLLGSKVAALMVEAVTRLGNYGDPQDHASRRAAVSKQLKAKGIRLPRGKRPMPGMTELVSDISPILIYYGIAPATGEGSPLVHALRTIALAVSISGDPREELRRVRREDAVRLRQQRAAIYEAVAKGLQSLKIITPP